MKKTHLIIPGLAITLLLAVITANTTFAFFGNPGKNSDPEKREEMQKVMENKDFEGWKALERTNCEARLNEMTEEDFNTFAERHTEQMQKGEAVRNAMEAGDYEAWKTAIANAPQKGKMFQNVDEATFAKMVEAHKLMQTGNIEGAKAIHKELGLQKGFRGEGLPGKGFPGGKKGHRFQE